MAQFNPSDLEKIIARDLPGHCLVPESQSNASREGVSDSVSAPLDAMQAKYAGMRSQTNSSDNSGQGVYGIDPTVDGVSTGEEVDDQIVLVQREDAAPSDDVGVAPKAFVVSGSEGRIIGAQG